MCREMHPLLLLYTYFSFLKPEILDKCAIFKIPLKNVRSKNNEPRSKLHK